MPARVRLLACSIVLILLARPVPCSELTRDEDMHKFSVLILAPQLGASVRLSRAMGVVVRILQRRSTQVHTEDVCMHEIQKLHQQAPAMIPQEMRNIASWRRSHLQTCEEELDLQDGEELPSGWVLMLSHDGAVKQAVGRKVGHIGDVHGLSEGPHHLCIWLEDESGKQRCKVAATHFWVGLLRPSVKITFPTEGAFVTDDPLTVLFSTEAFEMPGDGFVQESLNGQPRCTAQDRAQFHCDLNRVHASNHTVRVSLLRLVGVANAGTPSLHTKPFMNMLVASQSTNFAVWRPSVTIVYPIYIDRKSVV